VRPLALQQEESEAEDSVPTPARHRRSYNAVYVALMGALLLGLAFTVGRKDQASREQRQVSTMTDTVELYNDDQSLFVEPIGLALSGFPKPPPGEPLKYVVFRCGPNDYAGGFGDRLAGLFGAAYIALSMHRVLKVDWPELSEVFSENMVPWQYDPNELGISAHDQNILSTRHFRKNPDWPDERDFAGLSSDVVVMDAWKVDHPEQKWIDRAYREYPSDVVSGDARNSRVLIFSGNRGSSWDWYDHLQEFGLLPQGCSFWETYNAIFGALFRPNPTFFGMPVDVEVASLARPRYTTSVPLSKAIGVLKRPDTFSLGIHIRAGDEVIKHEANGEQCLNQGPNMDHVRCIMKLAKEKQHLSTRVLVIFSDSRCVKDKLMDWFMDSEAFTEVWTQKLTGSVNIDTTLSEKEDAEKHAFRQSMRDWIMMRYVDMFGITTSYSFLSGFPSSALVTSSVDKELYELNGCQVGKQNSLCASRFC